MRKPVEELDLVDKKRLNTLKAKGALKRIGGTRGYWEVLKMDEIRARFDKLKKDEK